MACKSLECQFYQITVFFLIIRIMLRNFAENHSYGRNREN